MPHSLSDFDYALPAELIAQAPPATRAASRLLHVDGASLDDLLFTDLPAHVAAGDLMVFNDTRVIRARLHGEKPTGGRVEALVERVIADDAAWVQLKASHMPKPGATITFGGTVATVVARDDRLFHLRFDLDTPLLDWLERHGEVPLPPYIARAAGEDDAARYQTVYARHAGAVAAPTAGLHFDQQTLDALQRRGVTLAFVTLHVGAGTFQPVEVDDIGRAQNARRALRSSGRDRGGHRDDARPRRPRPCRRHDLAARARIRCRRRRHGAVRAAPRPRFSSRRAIASASSTACSPISICHARRC